VVINFDDGRQAIFGHMSKVAVEAGQTVKQGDIIGYVGSTGKSTGPHVHIGFHGDLGNPYLGLKVGTTNIDHD
jgi:murein DD-endopeptidase MepM/ murein hydrolase activator NlpD